MKSLRQTKNKYFLLFVFAVSGCKTQTTEVFPLIVETTLVSFSAEQNTRTISCSSSSAIEAASSQPAWCSAKVVSWKNSAAIEVSVSKNVHLEERTATITVSSGTEKPVDIEVRQASGAPFFNVVADAELQFTPQSAQRRLTVNANVPFTATPSIQAWCTVDVDPDAMFDNVTVIVTENDGMDTRYAEIVFAAAGFQNIKITVAQSSLLTQKPDEEKFDDAGHRVFSKAEPLTYLKRVGPFVRLSNGSIFSPRGVTTCGISNDRGVTWTEYSVFNNPALFSLFSPVAVQTRKGTIIIGFANGRNFSPLNWNNTTHTYDPNANLPAYIIYSRDNGRTWSEPLKLHDGWTGMNRDMLETKDGHIVFSTMIMRNNLGRHCVVTYVSADDGETWTQSNILDSPTSAGNHGGLMEATIVQLNDDRLWMLIRTNWDYFYESYSSDNGLTWSAYQKTNIDASSSPGALLRLESGRIILVWNRLYHQGKISIARQGGDNNLSDVRCSWQRDELSMMYSDDYAKTWSTPFIVAENIVPQTNPLSEVGRLSYPHVFEQTKGVIWITDEYGNLRIAVKESDLPK